MQKIYKNFLNGESKLIDMFLCYPDLHQKLKEKWLVVTYVEQCTCFKRTYFPEVPITRKMHVMAFVISPLIAKDKTPNICYKYLKLEQMGERLHAIWNLLHRTRFFSVRNGNERLKNMFLEYENSLYIKK